MALFTKNGDNSEASKKKYFIGFPMFRTIRYFVTRVYDVKIVNCSRKNSVRVLTFLYVIT